MKALVFAGFLLGGWNVASALSVAKDTQSGKMPGPKSFGYTLAALLGVTGATLSYYSMKGQENPQLLASEDAKEVVCIRCNGLGDLCRGCSGLGADYPEEFGSCDLPPFPCPYCDTTGVASVSENMELVRKGFDNMSHYFDSANQELFGPKYLFSMKDNPKEDYEHPWIQLDDAKAAKLFDWIQDKYGIPPDYSQDIWENTPYKYKQEYDFPSEAASKKAHMERYKIDYPELFEKRKAEGWLTEGKCAICNNQAKFVVEDLPVGPRGFCCEACYADYVGLPVKEEGYYGLNAESSKSEGDLINEIIEDVFREFKIKTWSPRWYNLNNWDIPILESQPKDGEADVYIAHGGRRHYCSFGGKGKCFELSKAAMSDSLLKYVSDNDYGLWRYFPTEETKDKVKAYQEKLRKKYDLPIELFVKETYHDEEYGYEPSLIMGVSLGESEKNAESWQGISLAGTVDEIEEMLGRKKEAESKTFEAPKGPYTNASQEAFTKSYSRKAKNPWNKITKDVSFPKLGNQGRYSYNSSKITIPAANVAKAGGKKAAISLIRQYTAVSEYAQVGWKTRLNSPNDPNNQDLMEKQYGEVMQKTMLGSSGQLNIVMGLLNSTPFQNNPADYMEDTFTRASISSDRWENQIQGYIDTARMMRDLVRASDGFMKDIKMIGSNYAPVENDGGYGRTDYSARNPYSNMPTEGGYKYDDNDGTLKLPGNSYQYGKEWSILDKIRFYEATPPYKVGKSVAGTSYETEGGYGWRTSGSTTTYMDQALVQGNNGNVMSPERWGIQPVSFWGQNYSGDVGYYDMEDWETDRTPNYLYGTLVPWVRMPYMDKTNGDELNDIIIKLWEAKKSIKAKAQAAKKKEEQQAAAKQQREDQTNAINSFYTIQEEIDRLVKRKVNAATAAGIDPADILVYLEDLQVELEAYMTDLDLDEYLMEE